MRRRIKPAIAGTKVYYPGGAQRLPESGAMVDWDAERNRPRHPHWTRYITMGIVVEVMPPRSSSMGEVT